MNRSLFLLLCAGVLLGFWLIATASTSVSVEQTNRAAAVRAWLASPAGQDDGQAIFKQKCTACHTIGNGDLVGPDLKGVTNLRDDAWLTRWLKGPDVVLASGDPTATDLLHKYNGVPMPNLGLTDSQVAALIAYLKSQSEGAPPEPAGGAAPPPPAGAASPVGDPAAGRDLFTGVTRFGNGGPPCIACHSVAGIGSLGGGQVGPDLTPAVNKYGGEKGFTAFLSKPPTAVMSSVWGQRTFTPQELADVTAFLMQASTSGSPTDSTGVLIALIVGGTVILLALAQLAWRRRLVGVRRALLKRSMQ